LAMPEMLPRRAAVSPDRSGKLSGRLLTPNG
jgi:hypothetical protein